MRNLIFSPCHDSWHNPEDYDMSA